jgi:hypothetical protein
VQLQPYEQELYTYGGSKLVVCGKIQVNIQYKNNVYKNMQLIVVKTEKNQTILLGRDMLKVIKLNWAEIFKPQIISSEENMEDKK